MKNTLLSAAIIAALGFSVTLHANQQEQEATTGTTNNPTPAIPLTMTSTTPTATGWIVIGTIP